MLQETLIYNYWIALALAAILYVACRTVWELTVAASLVITQVLFIAQLGLSSLIAIAIITMGGFQ